MTNLGEVGDLYRREALKSRLPTQAPQRRQHRGVGHAPRRSVRETHVAESDASSTSTTSMSLISRRRLLKTTLRSHHVIRSSRAHISDYRGHPRRADVARTQVRDISPLPRSHNALVSEQGLRREERTGDGPGCRDVGFSRPRYSSGGAPATSSCRYDKLRSPHRSVTIYREATGAGCIGEGYSMYSERNRRSRTQETCARGKVCFSAGGRAGMRGGPADRTPSRQRWRHWTASISRHCRPICDEIGPGAATQSAVIPRSGAVARRKIRPDSSGLQHHAALDPSPPSK